MRLTIETTKTVQHGDDLRGVNVTSAEGLHGDDCEWCKQLRMRMQSRARAPSDYELLKALLTEWKVKFTCDPNGNDAGEGEIEVMGGYCGFFTTFLFNPNGKFKSMGAWE